MNQLEFKEAALQCAVEEWRSARRRQPDQLGQARVRREDVGAPAEEVALEDIAQARVERGESPRVARPHAIRRGRRREAPPGRGASRPPLRPPPPPPAAPPRGCST